MGSETPVLARVTEATAGNVEPPYLCDGTCRDEHQGQRRQNEQSAAVKEPQDKSKAAEQFQPWQIKGQPNAHRPRQHFVIVDVDGKSHWINGLDHARVNKDSANDEIQQTPEELRGMALQRFNDLTIERLNRSSLHLFDLSHSSHPPSRTKTFFNCASSRSRFATSRLALQLCALQ
jgi:hypothetical protein